MSQHGVDSIRPLWHTDGTPRQGGAFYKPLTAGDTCILEETVPIRNLVHAYLLSRFTPHYNRMSAAVKRRLLSQTAGDVLEIGAGTGANFAFFSPQIRWTGCDPNPAARRYAVRAAAAAGIAAHWQTAPAERLPFADGQFDAVVSTLTLCSVQSPRLALDEIRRVLRPGGEFLFLEHVAADPDSPLCRRQRRWAPVFGLLAGCRPHQDTAALAAAAGFSSFDFERLTLPLPIVGPHVAGRAIK
jgi:SAM-dependent methyltransferase